MLKYFCFLYLNLEPEDKETGYFLLNGDIFIQEINVFYE